MNNKNPKTNAYKPIVFNLSAKKLTQIYKDKKIKYVQEQNKRTHVKSVPKNIKTHRINQPIAVKFQDVVSETSIGSLYKTPSWFTNTSKVDVSIIVPLYKSNQVIIDQINSWVISKNYTSEIIYVDDQCPNNSKDTVITTWENQHSKLNGEKVGKIIVNSFNSGYGSACNNGVNFANGDYLIFLNADTKVTEGWIEPLIEPLKKDITGIVGNLQLKEGGQWDGYIDGAGSEWIWESESFVHIGRHSYHNKIINKPFKLNECPKDALQFDERDSVTGCCFSITKKLFKYLGGFDLNFRVGYWEDADICMRVKELNKKVYFTPNSIIYHKLGHSEASHHVHQSNNKNYFYNKWVNSGRIDNLISHGRKTKPLVKHILLKRDGANGDVLVASGVAAALKEKHPESKITFITKCPGILNNNPYIDYVLTFENQFNKICDLWYNLDFCYENRPYVNILDSYAEYVGVKRENCKVYLYDQPINFNLPDKYAVIHAGLTNWVGRNWEVNKWNFISNKLKELGYTIVCIGNNSDFKVDCDLDIRGKTNLHELAYVIKNSKLFVGIDSMPMHIAQSFDIKSAVFFGSIRPEYRIYCNNMIGITANVPCLGCHHQQKTPCVVTNICKQNTLECERNLNEYDFWNRLTQII